QTAIGPGRRESVFPDTSASMTVSPSIRTLMRSPAHPRWIWYHLPASNERRRVVSFSDASRPSIEEIPTSPPPHPPTTRVTHSPPPRAGKVRPQKKSVPSTRRASSSISKGGTGWAPVHFAPVSVSLQLRRSHPSSVTDTSPPITPSQASTSGIQALSTGAPVPSGPCLRQAETPRDHTRDNHARRFSQPSIHGRRRRRKLRLGGSRRSLSHPALSA